MSTSYGKNINISIYGGSHDEQIGIIARGLPKDFRISKSELYSFMQRRAPGQSELSTSRKEADIPIFLSGVTDNGEYLTLDGGELHAIIRNTSQRSSDYEKNAFIPRPSHADLAALVKYGEGVDLRGGGHFSGRLTAPLCIVGGICLQYLRARRISVFAHVYSVGDIKDTPFDLAAVGERERALLEERKDFPTLDEESGKRMRSLISDLKSQGNSVGAIIECAVTGLPIGLGEHMFDGVENRIASVIFGIPAVKGIEFGNGFDCAALTGSENNDAFFTDGEKIYTKTNNCGGILGGMTNGMPLVFRGALKPTPSILLEQDSVDMRSMQNVKLTVGGRHDPCIALRAVPVFEAAAAIAVCDMLFDT